MMNGQVIDKTPSLIQEVNGKTKNPVSQSPDPNHELETAHKLLKQQKEIIKQLRNPSEQKVKELVGKGELDKLIDGTRFKSSGKINWSKLRKLLGCSDKTAKKLITHHAPYLLKDDEMGYLE
jgi:Fic family protein